MKLVRSDEYMNRIFMDAIDKGVQLDVKVDCVYDYEKKKLRVVDPQTHTFIQFPNKLRRKGRSYIVDIIKQGGNGRAVFYRAYKGSIRNESVEVIG
jgi:hypothetical protein